MFWHLIISRSTYAIKAISPEWSCTIYIAKIASSVPRNHLQLKSHKNTVSSIQLLRLFFHVSACPPQSQSFLSCRKMTNANDEQHGLWPCGHLLLAWYSAWVQDPSPTQLIGFWWSSSAYWAPRCHAHMKGIKRPLTVGFEIWENCVDLWGSDFAELQSSINSYRVFFFCKGIQRVCPQREARVGEIQISRRPSQTYKSHPKGMALLPGLVAEHVLSTGLVQCWLIPLCCSLQIWLPLNSPMSPNAWPTSPPPPKKKKNHYSVKPSSLWQLPPFWEQCGRPS